MPGKNLPLVQPTRHPPPELWGVPGLVEVPLAVTPAGVSWLYWLASEHVSAPGRVELLVDYVGVSTRPAYRIARHVRGRLKGRWKIAESVITTAPPVAAAWAAPVLSAEARVVEEAFVRLHQPLYNLSRGSLYGQGAGDNPLRERDREVLRRWGVEVR